MGWRSKELWFDSQQGQEIIFFCRIVQTGSGPTQPPLQWVPEASSLGVKWLIHEADHWRPNSAMLKNEWTYNSNPLYTFMPREQFYLIGLIKTMQTIFWCSSFIIVLYSVCFRLLLTLTSHSSSPASSSHYQTHIRITISQDVLQDKIG